MSRRFRHRGQQHSDGDDSALLRHAQLINERAHILGLQLQQAALATRIAAAVRSYGQPTPQQQLHELLRRGVIHSDLAAARTEVAALKALLERVQPGRLASTAATPAAATRSGAGRQAGGTSAAARASGSKQYAALAVDHVRHWLDQAQEAVLLLEDLAAPGSIEEWPIESPEPPQPRPSGGPNVAHFIQRIPPELTALMQLPTTSYDQHPPPSPGPATAAASAAAAVLWDAAPLLRDPHAAAAAAVASSFGAGGGGGGGGGAHSSPPGSYRVACHESAELMWPSLAHGDLVLLLPGRYNWPEGTVLLRAAPSDVVIHNNEEDDVFVECAAGPPPPPPPPLGGAGGGSAAAATATATATAATAAGSSALESAGGVVFENLTLLQLGGYEGALRVLRGRTTLVDVVVQFTMGGLQVDNGGHLICRNVRVVGGATAGVQVAAGGVVELLGGCEVTRCGAGDDVVPKDLGGVEVMVPLADYPRLAPPSPRALLQAHAELLAAPPPEGGSTTPPPPPPPPASPSAAAASAAQLELLQPYLGAVQPPATVIIGPGCTIQNTRGFAVSLVKRKALAAYHELLYSSGGGGSAHATYGTNNGASGGAATASGCGCSSLSAALEGARVLVSRGSVLGPHNSRGAVGVVELEYHQLDGDAVNRRTASRHFHAVQVTARQLQEGFCSPGVDWTSYRVRLEGQPARPGRSPGVIKGSRSLRQMLVASDGRCLGSTGCGGVGVNGVGGPVKLRRCGGCLKVSYCTPGPREVRIIERPFKDLDFVCDGWSKRAGKEQKILKRENRELNRVYHAFQKVNRELVEEQGARRGGAPPDQLGKTTNDAIAEG
ncbi:hypothetical protein VOLCADRAFT_103892 [Volvox carteri f. nagariensis]|uniref:Right handed beta helix domain-containing protein n=1 Tax=Volvox carteri f. nagariensis TaxID=3068 RepID=D8TPX0_VOLCA|nr:uncharacterized protein VOLCADRAFT_103892 [Volvox carteri f. nagariensis]EFJ50302.1 hypothetical protein VOLCADRAFT_103892 [Volvox carteri f. nagariensis]|eukprot:XP_002948427.1 hypothetical protein VOLCADRAFT_103892 [Volvox carteri f. nagariensis]